MMSSLNHWKDPEVLIGAMRRVVLTRDLWVFVDFMQTSKWDEMV